jgi:hypothetical protein
MTKTPRTRRPQISASLCAQLSEAIKTVLSTTYAAEAASAKFIYEHGPQDASVQARDVADEAQLALWRLLHSNCEPETPHVPADTPAGEPPSDQQSPSHQDGELQ